MSQQVWGLLTSITTSSWENSLEAGKPFFQAVLAPSQSQGSGPWASPGASQLCTVTPDSSSPGGSSSFCEKHFYARHCTAWVSCIILFNPGKYLGRYHYSHFILLAAPMAYGCSLARGSNPSHQGDNAGSLTHGATRELHYSHFQDEKTEILKGQVVDAVWGHRFCLVRLSHDLCRPI